MKQLNLLRISLVALQVYILSSGILLPLYGNSIQKTIINGLVTNIDDPNELPALELINYMPFISEWETYSCFIEKDGVFQFEFEQVYPTGIIMRFKEMFSVFANPGDSIYLIIDAKMLSDTSKARDIEYKYVQIFCSKQKFQDEYQYFTRIFNNKFGSLENYLSLNEAQKNLDHYSYTRYIADRSEIYDAFLEEYINLNSPGKEFEEWTDNWLYLKGLEDLLRYAWLHPKYNKLVLC